MHRDVKLENLLMGSDGHVYLADFGLSEIVPEDQFFACKQSCGTLDNMAPEMFSGGFYGKVSLKKCSISFD